MMEDQVKEQDARVHKIKIGLIATQLKLALKQHNDDIATSLAQMRTKSVEVATAESVRLGRRFLIQTSEIDPNNKRNVAEIAEAASIPMVDEYQKCLGAIFLGAYQAQMCLGEGRPLIECYESVLGELREPEEGGETVLEGVKEMFAMMGLGSEMTEFMTLVLDGDILGKLSNDEVGQILEDKLLAMDPQKAANLINEVADVTKRFGLEDE